MRNIDLDTRVGELRRVINLHNYMYYVMDSPIISDSEFDLLFDDLLDMEKNHPELVSDDSPTQRVGGLPSDRFNKVEHPSPILSLSKVNHAVETKNWFDRMVKLDSRVATTKFVVEPKIDGLTVVLHYDKGMFVRGCTRGDGYIGEDITNNLRTIMSLPLRIPIKEFIETPDNLVVRGEVFIDNHAFDRLNENLSEKGEKVYINPRNAASGALRQLDPKVTASRPLSLYCYDLVVDGGSQITNQWDALIYLESLGFPISNSCVLCENIQSVIRICDEWQDDRQDLGYDIDGLVIKIDDFNLMSNLGIVGKDPRGAVAYKFPADEVTTEVVDISVNVGRTGILTPYAILRPVSVGGVVVKQATLHNLDFVQEKDIRIGDSVIIKRAGDVIPYVVASLPSLRTGIERVFKPPSRCPSCNNNIVTYDDVVGLYCTNSVCPDQVVRYLEHFVSRPTLDIDGFGKGIARLLVESGLIEDVADIFSLDRKDLLQLDGFADKKVDRLLLAIEESKKRTINRLIEALGIRGVGAVASVGLSRKFGSLDKLSKARVEDLLHLDGIGPNIANAIVHWFNQPNNQLILKKLKLAGFWPVLDNEDDIHKGVLYGKIFVITGKVQDWSRNDLKSYITSHGGLVTGKVTSKTNYLLVGENPGSKLEQARKLGVIEIDIEDLQELAS